MNYVELVISISNVYDHCSTIQLRCYLRCCYAQPHYWRNESQLRSDSVPSSMWEHIQSYARRSSLIETANECAGPWVCYAHISNHCCSTKVGPIYSFFDKNGSQEPFLIQNEPQNSTFSENLTPRGRIFRKILVWGGLDWNGPVGSDLTLRTPTRRHDEPITTNAIIA